MSQARTTITAPPVKIGPYAVQRMLGTGQTYLASGPGGRRTVLKMLEADCLLRGQLHPSIRQRLARVRELPARGVANLCAVERGEGWHYLVWEYVEGRIWDDWAAGRAHEELTAMAREVVMVVESLHACGIVHGALHGRNIIITPAGTVMLTHVSPLLYDEASDDVKSLIDLLGAAAGMNLEHVKSLRQLGAVLAGDAAAAASSGGAAAQGNARVHWAMVWAALTVAAVGAGIAWAIAYVVRGAAEGRP